MPKTNRVVLNDKRIKALTVPAGRQSVDLYDALVPGLVLRGTKAGRRMFYVWYRDRIRKKVIWVLVRESAQGPYEYPIMGLARARIRAIDILTAAGEGRSPGAEQAAIQTTQALVHARTFRSLCACYFAEQPLKPASFADYSSVVRQRLAPLADLPVTDITRDHIRAIVDPIRARGKQTYANKVVACLSSILSYGVKKDWLESHPMWKKITQRKLQSRRRVLSDAELQRVWALLDSPPDGSPSALVQAWPLLAAWCRLRIVTAQRSSEVLGMQWSHLRGLDTKRPIWEIPDTKNGKPQVVPLSPLAVRLITEVRQAQARRKLGKACDVAYVFAGIRSVKARWGMTARLGLDDLQLRDFRRSAATNMGMLKTMPYFISRVLNHTDGSITGIYNKWEYEAEKRQALNKWAAYLQRLLKPLRLAHSA